MSAGEEAQDEYQPPVQPEGPPDEATAKMLAEQKRGVVKELVLTRDEYAQKLLMVANVGGTKIKREVHWRNHTTDAYRKAWKQRRRPTEEEMDGESYNMALDTSLQADRAEKLTSIAVTVPPAAPGPQSPYDKVRAALRGRR